MGTLPLSLSPCLECLISQVYTVLCMIAMQYLHVHVIRGERTRHDSDSNSKYLSLDEGLIVTRS